MSTKNKENIEDVPKDLLQSEPKIRPQPLNAFLKDPQEREVRQNREPADNDKIMNNYHLDE